MKRLFVALLVAALALAACAAALGEEEPEVSIANPWSLVPAQNCPALSGWALSGHHLRPELLSVPQLQRTALLAHESYSQGPTPAHPRLRAAILCHLQP